MEIGAVGHKFESDPPKDHHCQVSYYLVQFKMAAVTKYKNFFNCSLLL
jgi:hypothetical protein